MKDFFLAEVYTDVDLEPKIYGVDFKENLVSVFEAIFDGFIIIEPCLFLFVDDLVFFFTGPDFLLEYVLCLALPKPPEVHMGLFHSFSDFSEQIVDSFVLVNVNKDTFGVVLHPARF